MTWFKPEMLDGSHVSVPVWEGWMCQRGTLLGGMGFGCCHSELCRWGLGAVKDDCLVVPMLLVLRILPADGGWLAWENQWREAI